MCENTIYRYLNWSKITLLSSCTTVRLLCVLYHAELSIPKKCYSKRFFKSCSSSIFMVTYKIIIKAHLDNKINHENPTVFKMFIVRNSLLLSIILQNVIFSTFDR